MGKSSKTTQTQNTVAEPWKEAHPLLRLGLAKAEDLFTSGQLTPQPYGAPGVAAESGYTTTARDNLANIATGGNTITPNVINAYNNALSGGAGDISAVKDAALRGAVPAAASYFENAGMLNSSVAGEGISEAATRAIAPIEFGAWTDAQNRALRGISMAPQMVGIPYADAEMLARVGQAQDMRNQAVLQDEISRYYENEDYDYNDLGRVTSLGMGFGGVGGTTSGSQIKSTPQSLFGPILQGVGAIASMWPSDRRLKRDIKRTGTTPGGVPVYTFRYLWDDTLYKGVMADEVPWAVVNHPSGYDMVDYARIS